MVDQSNFQGVLLQFFTHTDVLLIVTRKNMLRRIRNIPYKQMLSSICNYTASLNLRGIHVDLRGIPRK